MKFRHLGFKFIGFSNQDLDNFSSLTSFWGGLVVIIIHLAIGKVLMYARGFVGSSTMCCFSLFISFIITLIFPYMFCSCKCYENSTSYSLGRVSAAVGAAIGWGICVVLLLPLIVMGYSPPMQSSILPFPFLMFIPILSFLFSRAFCIKLKALLPSPNFEMFFVAIIAYFFLLGVGVFLLPQNYPLFWFLFTIIFWALILAIVEYLGQKSISHYLNNMGVALIALSPLESGIWGYYVPSLLYILYSYFILFIIIPIFSLIYCILKRDKTYLYDAICVFSVALACSILEFLPLLRGYL